MTITMCFPGHVNTATSCQEGVNNYGHFQHQMLEFCCEYTKVIHSIPNIGPSSKLHVPVAQGHPDRTTGTKMEVATWDHLEHG